MIEAVAVAVADETQPGEARRVASGMARLLGFDETSAGRVAVVVTEVATNIVKHGGGGEVLIRPLQQDDERGIELLGLDKGPGITNLTESRVDGVSRSGSAGTGSGGDRADGRRARDLLPARHGERRCSRASGRDDPARLSGLAWRWRGSAWPSPARATCGDGWAMTRHASGAVIVLADGLGHGPEAAEAAQRGDPDFPEAHQRGAGRDTQSRPRCPAQHSRGGGGYRRCRL